MLPRRGEVCSSPRALLREARSVDGAHRLSPQPEIPRCSSPSSMHSRRRSGAESRSKRVVMKRDLTDELEAAVDAQQKRREPVVWQLEQRA